MELEWKSTENLGKNYLPDGRHKPITYFLASYGPVCRRPWCEEQWQPS